MSASYFGTFPVKKLIGMSRDINGVRTATAQIIAREDSVDSEIPAIDSEFEFDPTLWVTSADVSYQTNGLAQITVTASGPPEVSTARVFVVPGGPFIYGLLQTSGAPRSTLPYPTNFSPSSGQSVEVTFVNEVTNSQDIIETYLRRPMPASILGVTLPTPAAGRGNIQNDGLNVPEVFVPGITLENINPAPLAFQGVYFGFICKDVILQPQGRAVLVRLVFKESGYLIIGNETIFNF